MLGKLSDGISMIWASLDERERFLLLWGVGTFVIWVMALAMADRRKDDLDAVPQPPLVVLLDGTRVVPPVIVGRG